MTANANDLLTVSEIARMYGCAAETVRRWISSGRLHARKIGNQLFVERAEVDRFARPGTRPGREARLALLAEIDSVRERIRQHVGGNVDVLEMLDRSRGLHP